MVVVYTCKHKNIADELKKRNPDCRVAVKPDNGALVTIHKGGNEELMMCNEVLVALGYAKKPEVSVSIGLHGSREPKTIGAYPEPWRTHHVK